LHESHINLIENSFTDKESTENADKTLAMLYRKGTIKSSGNLVQDTAWFSAKFNGSLHGIKTNELHILSKVYSSQAYYKELTNVTISNMSIADFLGAKSTDYLGGIYQSINSLWWAEKYLLSSYEEAIKSLEKSDNYQAISDKSVKQN